MNRRTLVILLHGCLLLADQCLANDSLQLAGSSKMKFPRQKKIGQLGMMSLKVNTDYLPLTGGTLSGQLNGTSAIFSGALGIGVSSPDYKLDVASSGTAGFRVQTAASTVGGPQLDLSDATRGTETIISSTDGSITGTYIASYSNHPLLFATNHATAQMTLLANGNLGIGTTSPAYKLETVTSGKMALRLQTSASSIIAPQMDLYDASGGIETIVSSTDGTTAGAYIATYSNHPLMLATNHTGAQVTLLTNGNLGIGTTQPAEKLSVDGNIKTRKLIVIQSP